ncbi:hypothetical protein KBC03_08355 [Patescibacteria group bacterium]|nr:hypothetical protein [Patescibacteria group bacterium]
MPGVEEFLQEAKKDSSIILGISSGASLWALNQLIEFFQLDIPYYTSADEVEHKKPAPDVFLKTFEKM